MKSNQIKSHHIISYKTGMVIGVPNPSPGDTLPLQQAIEAALLSADREGVRGALVTPYVLAMVEKLTKGNQ